MLGPQGGRMGPVTAAYVAGPFLYPGDGACRAVPTNPASKDDDMSETPDFWRWYYHCARKWKAPPGTDVFKIVGFALIMATFGDDGRNIWPSAATLVGRANVHERTASTPAGDRDLHGSRACRW